MIERLEYGKYCQKNGGAILEGAEYRELGKSPGFPHTKDLDAWAPWYLQPGKEPNQQKEIGLSAYFPVSVTNEAETESKQATKVYHTLQRVRFVDEKVTNRRYRVARVLSTPSSEGHVETSSPLLLFMAHQQEKLQGLTKTATNNLKQIDEATLLKSYNTDKEQPTLGHFKIVNDIMNGLPVCLLNTKGDPIEEAVFYKHCDIIRSLLPLCLQKYFSALWNGEQAELRSSPFKLSEVVHTSQLVMLSSPCTIDHNSRNYELSGRIIRLSTKLNSKTSLNTQYPFALYDHKGNQNEEFSFLFKDLSSNQIPEVMEYALEAISRKEKNLVNTKTHPKPIVYRLPKVREAGQHFSCLNIVNELSGWSSFEHVKVEFLKYLGGQNIDLDQVLLSLESQHLRLILLLHLYDEFTELNSNETGETSKALTSDTELNFFNIYCALEIEILNPTNQLTQQYLKNQGTLKTFDTLQSLMSVKKAESMIPSISIFTDMLSQLLNRWEPSSNQKKRGLQEYISTWTRLLDLYLLYLRSLKGKKLKRADQLWTLVLQHHQHPFLEAWVRKNIVEVCLNIFKFRFRGQVFQGSSSKLERLASRVAISSYMKEIHQFRRSDAQKKRYRVLDHFMILNIEQGLSPSISNSLEYIANVRLQHSTKFTKAFLATNDADLVDEAALVDWILERHHYYPVLEGEHLLRVNQVINKNVDLLIERWIENKSTSGLKLIFSHLDMDLVNLFSISMSDQNAKVQSAKALDQLNHKSEATLIKTAQFKKVSGLSQFNIGPKRWSILMRTLIGQFKSLSLPEKEIKVEALFNLLSKDKEIDKTNCFIRSLLSHYFSGKSRTGHSISVFDATASTEDYNKDSYILCQPFAADQSRVSADDRIAPRMDIQRYNKEDKVFLGLDALEVFQLITWPFGAYDVKEPVDKNTPFVNEITNLAESLSAKFYSVVNEAKEKKIDSRNFGFLYTTTWILSLLRAKFGNRTAAVNNDEAGKVARQRLDRMNAVKDASSEAKRDLIDHVSAYWPNGEEGYVKSILAQSKLLHSEFLKTNHRYFDQDHSLLLLLSTPPVNAASNVMFTSEFVRHELFLPNHVRDPQQLYAILFINPKLQLEIIKEIEQHKGQFYEVLIKNLRSSQGINEVKFGWTKKWFNLNWFIAVQPLQFNFYKDTSTAKKSVKSPRIIVQDELNYFEPPNQIHQSDGFQMINGANVLYVRPKAKSTTGIKLMLAKLQKMLKELNSSTSVSARTSPETSPETPKPMTADES